MLMLVAGGGSSPAEIEAAVVRLLELGLIVAAIVFAVRVLRHGPYGLPRRMQRRFRARAHVTWIERPFLGWTRTWLGTDGWAVGAATDTVGVVGPHDSGKTHGVLIPQALLWGGPLISTSTKPDVLRATAGRRQALAEQLAGKVYVYAPTTPPGVLIEGLRPVHWSPLAGCTDPQVTFLRVEALVNTTQVGRGVEDPTHWRAGAARVLRPYFFAAAHHKVRSGDLTVVRQWLSNHEFEEPLAILDGLRSFEADQWATELRGVADTPPRERGSFFSAAEHALAATANPNVLRSSMETELDPVEFLATRSTLYIVSPSEHQAAVAPLISALIESIVVAAYELHRVGRLEHRLLLSLDELANIAPLPSLGSIASQGNSQGVNLCWAAQSLAQLRERYGVHAADAIWSETTAQIVFGGMSDGTTLQGLSSLIGERLVTMRGTSTENWTGRRHRTRMAAYRPRVTPAQLAQLRPGWALLFHRPGQAFALRAPIVEERRAFRPALLQWPAPTPAEKPAVLEPAEE